MSDQSSQTSDEVAVFKDAEAFLAELGVERRPLVVTLPDAEPGEGELPMPALGRPAVSTAEAVRIASELPLDEEAVKAALSTIYRSTAAAPASEGRLRRRLVERGYDDAVVAEALRRAREQRFVDDGALSASLIAEWRSQGHAPRRIRDSLRKRGFDEPIIAQAMQVLDDEDPFAAAFDLAVKRARALDHLDAEAAYRRVVGFVARRGHNEGIARKAARDAVYDARERDRTTGR